jgi:regulator of sigma E protease
MVVVLSAVAFVLLITGLILVHELGHYLVARWSGVEVEEFGFGLPPRAITLFRKWGTNFTLNWIPFGGFVRLKGENAIDPDAASQKGSFPGAPIYKRSLILLAGVAMNFLVALVIFLGGFSVGHWVPTYLTLEEMQAAADRNELTMRTAVSIDDVLEGGGAKDAGVEARYLITAVDGEPVTTAEDVVRLQQGKRTVDYSMTSPTALADGQEGAVTKTVSVEDGKTGVHLRTILLESSAPTRGPVEATRLALREVKVVTVQTVIGIARLFGSLASQGTVPPGVTGIVGIAQLTYSSVQEGFGVYLRLVALLSLSLAVLNVLPFPALDGGRLIFVLSELFVRPGTRRVEAITNAIGFVVLLAVILLVTFYDVLRLFAS